MRGAPETSDVSALLSGDLGVDRATEAVGMLHGGCSEGSLRRGVRPPPLVHGQQQQQASPELQRQQLDPARRATCVLHRSPQPSCLVPACLRSEWVYNFDHAMCTNCTLLLEEPKSLKFLTRVRIA